MKRLLRRFGRSPSPDLALAAIDACEYRQGVLLLQGWLRPSPAAARDTDPLKVVVRGDRGANRWQLEVPADLERQDVPQKSDVRPVGFFFYGQAPGERPTEVVVCSAGAEQVIHRFHPTQWARLALRVRMWGGLARQGLALVREGQWKALRDKAGRHLGALSSRQAMASSALGERLSSEADLLVVDHDLGGGANQYRHALVEEAHTRGQSVAVLSYSLLRLNYHLRLLPAVGRPQNLGLLSADDAVTLLRDHAPQRLVFNNATSFPEALRIVQAMADAKAQAPHRHLTFAVHDYFALCPSAHLLDAQGRYCGLPTDPERCARCLASNPHGFVALYRQHGLAAWRDAFGAALSAADEVRIFSPSSRTLLERAYPGLSQRTVRLIPHTVPTLDEREHQAVAQWRDGRTPSGHILVVGSINEAKGAKLVASLLAAIERAELPYRVEVVGSVSPRPPASAGRYAETGPYDRDALTRHVLAADPDLILLPSIVPETFSYVLHELGRYGLPIAAYDIGAQADFLRGYPEAVMVPYGTDGGTLLNALRPWLPQAPPAPGAA